MLNVMRIDSLTDVQSECKNVSNASKIDIRGYMYIYMYIYIYTVET